MCLTSYLMELQSLIPYLTKHQCSSSQPPVREAQSSAALASTTSTVTRRPRLPSVPTLPSSGRTCRLRKTLGLRRSRFYRPTACRPSATTNRTVYSFASPSLFARLLSFGFRVIGARRLAFALLLLVLLVALAWLFPPYIGSENSPRTGGMLPEPVSGSGFSGSSCFHYPLGLDCVVPLVFQIPCPIQRTLTMKCA
ncbi:hypothetical protein N658DRAFT_94793 [Parathielavia hyrcaniae]|uniref:Uncharacterized protein n=1 Tax=Parathielavia hyrcaniae TaxID=113614 RepID=A0AAN6PRQ7_9PEZI|nr:hypothetical protein N658DRAFT_94793 [Parathielavia hyrcaniae]